MDIDGPPTASPSRPSTSASISTPRPLSAGVKLPGIRTLPGFQIPSTQHETASGSGLGPNAGRDRDWNSVRDREQEALRDREALREMDWERERVLREREGLRGFGPGIGSGMGDRMGYDGYGGGRSGLGKDREFSLPMPTPVSRPLSIVSVTEDRPRSRGYTSSATLNSILSVPGPPESFSHAQPRPLSSASRSLSSPSPFAHGAVGSGLPPIGHGLLATGRKSLGGTSGEMGMGGGGGGSSGGRWTPGHGQGRCTEP